MIEYIHTMNGLQSKFYGFSISYKLALKAISSYCCSFLWHKKEKCNWTNHLTFYWYILWVREWNRFCTCNKQCCHKLFRFISQGLYLGYIFKGRVIWRLKKKTLAVNLLVNLKNSIKELLIKTTSFWVPFYYSKYCIWLRTISAKDIEIFQSV